MVIRVKICGLTTTEAVEAAVAGGAAFAGFVFFARSPRNLALADARALRDRVPASVKAVALLVDPDDATVAAVIDAVRPDLLQLHGHEAPARVATIRDRFGVPVMKALPVASATDLEPIPGYAAVADMLLFDAKPDVADTRPGGNARAFDWGLLHGIDCNKPWMLAGGLTAGNLGEAVRASRAQIVDVSSGVETAPGQKDPRLITAFLTAAQTISPPA